MQSKKRNVSVVLAVLLVGSTLSTVYMFWQQEGARVNMEKALATPVLSNESPAGQPSTEKYAGNEWKTWEDSYYSKDTGNTFSYALKYPRDFDVSNPFLQTTQDQWKLFPKVQMSFPRDAYAFEGKNNFREARMDIYIDKDPSSTACSTNAAKSEYGARATSTVEIGGTIFWKATGSGAAAGSYYETENYGTKIGNQCMQIELTVGNVNRGVYDNPNEIKEIDPARPFAILHKILDTLSIKEEAGQR